MVKREWGAKHICMDCGVKFYDLHRSPIACPRCGSVIEIETVRPGRRRQSAQPQPMPPANGKTGGPAGAAIEIAAVDGGETTAADDDKVIGDDTDEDGDAMLDDLDDAEPTLPAA